MTDQIKKLLNAFDKELENLEEHLETNDYLSFESIGALQEIVDLLKGELEDAKPM